MSDDSIRLLNGGIGGETFAVVRTAVERRLREHGLAPGGVPVTLRQAERGARFDYAVEDEDGGLCVFARDLSGFMAGAGRVLLDGRFEAGGFKPGTFRGAFTSKRELLGTYFATHFGNYYVNAPIDEIGRLIEDLALYGQNYLPVWFDMHHFTGADDPRAIAFAARLKAILEIGRRVGMKISLGGIANEAFSTTPEALKAQWHKQGIYKSGISHYHVEICPHLPGGIEKILQNRRDMMDLFRDIQPDITSFGIYDQGGCTCPKCAPYGAKTYLDLMLRLKDVVREYWPSVEVMLSGWLLGHPVDGEWEYWYDELGKPEYDDFHYIKGISTAFYQINPRLLAGDIPGGKKLLGFPEVSMYSCLCDPWGGYGANPYPKKLQKDFDQIGAYLSGMTTYSEGNYEDANKAAIIAMYSGRCATMEEGLREYARFEFGREHGDEIASILVAMEDTLEREVRDAQGRTRCVGVSRADKRPDEMYVDIVRKERIREIAERTEAVEAKLPAWAKESWRWRFISLRARIDRMLLETNGYLNDAVEAEMAKLNAMYHTDENSFYVISAATRASILRHYGDA